MSITISLKVQPNSHAQRIIIGNDHILKLYLTSQPEKNRANREIVQFFANTLSLPHQSIRIVAGHTSKLKKVVFDLLNSVDELYRKLGIHQQQKLIP